MADHYTAASLSIHADALRAICDAPEVFGPEKLSELARDAAMATVIYDPRTADERAARAQMALLDIRSQSPDRERMVALAREALDTLREEVSGQEIHSGHRFVEFVNGAFDYLNACIADHVPTQTILEVADKAWSQQEAGEGSDAAWPGLVPSPQVFKALFDEAGYRSLAGASPSLAR